MNPPTKKRALDDIVEEDIVEDPKGEGSSTTPVVYSAYQLLMEGKCELVGKAGDYQANYSELLRDLYRKISVLDHNFELLVRKIGESK